MNFWYQTNIMGQFWPLIRPEDIDWSFTSLLTLNFCLFVCLFVDWRRHSDSVPGICAYSSHSSTNRVLLFSVVAWRNSKNYQVGRWDRPSEINLQRKTAINGEHVVWLQVTSVELLHGSFKNCISVSISMTVSSYGWRNLHQSKIQRTGMTVRNDDYKIKHQLRPQARKILKSRELEADM